MADQANDSLSEDVEDGDTSISCLGMTFPNESERRSHFRGLLAEKLEDPSFRSQDGFPNGSDEAILDMSDPPYYTACPNPWLNECVEYLGNNTSEIDLPMKEPFVSDVSEKRSGLFYDAHSYHTKVPHKAIMRYILYYTNPGDVVLDTFCGTGMTGVAAQLCGSKSAIEELGYRVDSNGTVYQKTNSDGKAEWREFSKIGTRKAILNDLSPAATFICANYNTKIDSARFGEHAVSILDQSENEIGYIYETNHGGSAAVKGRINYTIWSDIFRCPECAGEINFWESGFDSVTIKLRETITCPHCSTRSSKTALERCWISLFDTKLNSEVKFAKQVPVLINYNVGKERFDKSPDQDDYRVLDLCSQELSKYDYPTIKIPTGDKTGEPIRVGIHYTHQFYTHRNLLALAHIRSLSRDNEPMRRTLEFLINAYDHTHSTKMTRVIFKSNGKKPVLSGNQSGTLYFPSLPVEKNVLSGIRKNKLDIVLRSLSHISGNQVIQTGNASSISIPSCSVDYIFIDPPFGKNIMYSELNYLSESWAGVFTNPKAEAVESRSQGKKIDDYRRLMTEAFTEAFRVLKPGRWITVEFSNTQAKVWNSIQTSLQESGFVVANVSVLDKKQGSFNAVNNSTSVKQDLVISAYKPNGGLSERFVTSGGDEESVWDFVSTHLNYLPIVKVVNAGIEYVKERDPRILFDRMVAWFVQNGSLVPLSSQEFQAGLESRFVNRDGMIFLPEQVTTYDRRRAQSLMAPQIELFVSDERSSIDWLTKFLRDRPSTYQEIHPKFVSQLDVGWKKHEEKPELASLLLDNFLIYDGSGHVPSQIHSFLSTNYKDMRGLEKDNSRLREKAKDRWYVPDPKKARDLEAKRERALIKEFESYKGTSRGSLREVRLEVLRAGFDAAWKSGHNETIVKVAERIPDNLLQEDEYLVQLYDMARTRCK